LCQALFIPQPLLARIEPRRLEFAGISCHIWPTQP
jgi:hypothetical protein